MTSSTTAARQTDAQAKAANTRFNRACKRGEKKLHGTGHSSDLLMYYKHLVARCGDTTHFVATQGDLATSYGTTMRSVQRYDAHLEALGLIWRRKVGRSYRRTITSYEPKPCDEPIDEQPAEVVALDDPDVLLDAAASAFTAGDAQRAQVLAWQAAMARAQVHQRAATLPDAAGDSVAAPRIEACFSPPNDDRLVMLNTTDRSGTTLKDSDSVISHPASAVCRPYGDDGNNIHRHRNRTGSAVPDTEATRVLPRYGVRSPAVLGRHSAAPLERIEQARRRIELDAEPGMIVQILDDNGLVWKGGGQRVDNRPTTPALDDEDAWRERSIGGELGRYIIGGLTDAPPDVDDAPPPAPERARCDAARAGIDGGVPPTLRPLPAPQPTPPDDPAVDNDRGYGGLPQGDQGDRP